MINFEEIREEIIRQEEKEELDEINLDELLAELELDEDARTDAEEEGYKDGHDGLLKNLQSQCNLT